MCLVGVNRNGMRTATSAGLGFKAGVKDYRLTYYMKDYRVDVTDLLAAFRVIAQPGVPPEEAGAAIAVDLLREPGLRCGHTAILRRRFQAQSKSAGDMCTTDPSPMDDQDSFIDNIFRFVQAGSEVSALLGRLTSAALGRMPTW